MAKKYFIFRGEASANFEDVINIIIQLDSLEIKVNVILIVINEKLVY